MNDTKRMISIRAALIALAALAALSFAPAGAGAQEVSRHVLEGSFDGHDSTAGSFGGSLNDIAVDRVSGAVYVARGAFQHITIDKFNAAGQAAAFSSPTLHGSTSLTIQNAEGSFEGGVAMAVDNSSGPTQGRIYVGDPQQTKILSFNPDGTPAGEFAADPFGLAVDPRNGDVWESDHSGAEWLEKYSSEGDFKQLVQPVGDFNNRMAVDSTGSLYVVAREFTDKYDAEGNFLYHLETNLDEFPLHAGVTVDTSNDEVYVLRWSGTFETEVSAFNSRGSKVESFSTPTSFNSQQGPIAVNPTTGTLYVGQPNAGKIWIYKPGPPVSLPEATTGTGEAFEAEAVTLDGTADPAGSPTTICKFEWTHGLESSYQNSVPCSQGTALSGAPQHVNAQITGLTKGDSYHYRLVVGNPNGPVKGLDRVFTPSADPTVSGTAASDAHADSIVLHATLAPEGADTTYDFEYGTAPCSSGGCSSTPQMQGGTGVGSKEFNEKVTGLEAGATYYYRMVADNQSGTTEGLERTFKTFSETSLVTDECPNAHVRQQTGTALLLDCRAYELVSDRNTGGYDVESTLVAGQNPFQGYAHAEGPSRVLYGTHGGGIPEIANPTNHGVDPYLATRTESGWVTSYPGIPANNPYAAGPFGSGVLAAGDTLGTLAFGGGAICAPCFADGSSGIPVRLPDGELVQGMTGSNPNPGATPEGHVGRALSADGEHLIFGSTEKFETAGNEDGDLTIYERDLGVGDTQVVSTLPGGQTMTGAGIGELDVSADGSRVLVGQAVSTDGAGNTYWKPYMHVGDSTDSVELAPGATAGVLFDGMTADGSRVFFTTADKLLGTDTDSSPDIYEATISGGSATLRLVSVGGGGPSNSDSCAPAAEWNVVSGGPNCGAVAYAGGAGLASQSGTIYFLSPEQLDGGNGVAGQPNLYVEAPGSTPSFVATVDQFSGTVTDEAILHAVRDHEAHHWGDFQVTPDGGFAAFSTTQSLTEYINDGHSEVYRYDSGGIDCASCPQTNTRATGDATLPRIGLGLTDKGQVFFNSTDALAPRDLDQVGDAYEWEGGEVQLISTGTSPTASDLLGATADGVDAFFFTHDTLVPQDVNGNHVKIYDARELGGFAFTPEEVPCKASDECHGRGSEAAPSPPINTHGGEGGNTGAEVPTGKKNCAKGKVRKHGKCVVKHKHKKKGRKDHRKHGGHRG